MKESHTHDPSSDLVGAPSPVRNNREGSVGQPATSGEERVKEKQATVGEQSGFVCWGGGREEEPCSTYGSWALFS
jgi:hypothetical protein